MRRRFKIWTNIFYLVIGLTILNYIFRIIPNFEELLNSDKQFWRIANLGEKIQRIGYYLGYLFPFSIFILWFIKSYFKPENVLKRKGYRQEIKNLTQLLKSNSITQKEYNDKIELLEAKNIRKNTEKANQIKASKSEQELNQEYKTLLELKQKGILTQKEFEQKETVIELEKNGNQIKIELIEKLVNIYDFKNQDTEKYLSENFTPKIENRTTEELIFVLKSDGYRLPAKYQAYVELKKRNTTGNKV